MMLKEILIKLAINAVLLYGVALLTRGRIKFGGIGPVLAAAVFLVPINVFMPDLVRLTGMPATYLHVLAGSIVLNGVVLYALCYLIPGFSVENIGVAIAYLVILGLGSVALNFFLADEIVPGFAAR